MEIERNKRNEMYNLCVSELQRAACGDMDSMARAVYTLRWLKGESRLLEPLLGLLENEKFEIRLFAIEGLGCLKLDSCVQPLIERIERSFGIQSEESRRFRKESIRALGKNGDPAAIDYLASVMRGEAHDGEWSEDERSLAAEALTLFALDGSIEALKIIAEGLEDQDGFVREVSKESMLEITEKRFWSDEGYHSFIAKFEVGNGQDE